MIHDFDRRGDDGQNHKLADFLALLDLHHIPAVVEQYHPDTASIAAVNGAPAGTLIVRHHAAFRGQQADKARRDCSVNARVEAVGGAGEKVEIFPAVQIQPSIRMVGTGGENRPVIQHDLQRIFRRSGGFCGLHTTSRHIQCLVITQALVAMDLATFRAIDSAGITGSHFCISFLLSRSRLALIARLQ